MGKSALLVLEDGTRFYGRSIGVEGLAVGEVVFNTSMTGYQEILTDPSYARQIVTLTCPHIGNVGSNSADQESTRVHAQALVVRNMPLSASNFRSEEGFSAYLKRHQVVAIAEIDTRQLTHLLRQGGAQRGCIVAGDQPDATLALQQARACPSLDGMDLATVVTTAEPYGWCQGSWLANGGLAVAPDKQRLRLPYRVVVYDFGVKRAILRQLVDRGCQLTVVPAETTARSVLAGNFDGIVLSNGPGDPTACHYAIQAIQTFLQHDIPLFGICLGHQLLALACGARTKKMKFGHHGSNHPVQDQQRQRVMITAQNHGFTVDAATLPACLEATHWSLFDGSLQGLRHLHKPAFSFQGHPEANPGPQDASGLFDQFVTLIQHYRHRNHQSNHQSNLQSRK